MKANEPLILADTSCWVEYFHPQGSEKAKRLLMKIIEEDRAAICGPVICEVLRGATQSEVKRLRQVFSGVHYLAQQDEEWKHVEELALKLQRRGSQPPLLDLLIAAIAWRHNATLSHFGDKHFEAICRILPVRVVNLKGVRA
ncbi:PIN domain-containing protein [Acidobacteria bacterium AH-259-G07]|nr:PIN domain-containing protein [Acidobacteria bacterium AH-259-G07]